MFINFIFDNYEGDKSFTDYVKSKDCSNNTPKQECPIQECPKQEETSTKNSSELDSILSKLNSATLSAAGDINTYTDKAKNSELGKSATSTFYALGDSINSLANLNTDTDTDTFVTRREPIITRISQWFETLYEIHVLFYRKIIMRLYTNGKTLKIVKQ
jgi:hypothetical protein